MKLNNKGFAITGILYTLFVLFALILVSVLAGLSSKLKILEKSVDSFADDYEVATANYDILAGGEVPSIALEDGEYIYSNGNRECYVYLKSGSTLEPNDLTFVTASCNDIKSSLSLKGYYSFKKDGS